MQAKIAAWDRDLNTIFYLTLFLLPCFGFYYFFLTESGKFIVLEFVAYVDDSNTLTSLSL